MPADRLAQLVACATDVFIDRGYRHTQMADVAEAMGIAKGTLYLYVESKEALFDLVCRCADRHPPFDHPPKLPIPTPRPGATLKYIRDRLTNNPLLPTLRAAATRTRADDPRAELEGILRALYGLLAHNRRGIKLMDRSAQYHPRLAAVWFKGARGDLVDALVRYLEARIRQRRLRPVPDARVAARLIIETSVTWAVHRHWDPSPQTIDDHLAEDTVVHFLSGGLCKEDRV
jgi:AcrR family transcriptional regulator